MYYNHGILSEEELTEEEAHELLDKSEKESQE